MPNTFQKARDPISSYTHFIGACFSVLGTLFLIACSLFKQSGLITLISSIIFGISLIALYSASSVYHYVKGSDKLLLHLRKLDHAMIYVLIAGTYTPIALHFMTKQKGIIFTVAIWSVAILGILIKLCWLNAPRALYTSLYLIMGWAILFDVNAFKSIPIPCLSLIAAGGISYTIGAVIYILKKPNISNFFGFHEIFHVFVMLGSAFHFLAIYLYII